MSVEAPRRPAQLFVQPQSEAVFSPEEELSPEIYPLGAFSAFVLHEQPDLLSQVRSGEIDVDAVIARQREVFQQVDPQQIERVLTNPSQARTAHLDLTFAMSAVTFSKGEPAEEISALNARVSEITGLPPFMTFESVISVNAALPFQQMRAFTNGEAGYSERMFYYGHDLMDRGLQHTTNLTREAIEALESGSEEGIEIAVTKLQESAAQMEEFADFMRAYQKLDKTHFATFRQYLASYPDGKRNASGAFMGMPRLQLRLSGTTPMYEVFVDESMQYFPTGEQADIQQARAAAQEGRDIISLTEQLPSPVRARVAQEVRAVIQPIYEFRLTHLSAVQRFVPDALDDGLKKLKEQLEQPEEPILEGDGVKGTGGFAPGPLLRNMIRMDMAALQRLDAIIDQAA